jgi:hypothetical protein
MFHAMYLDLLIYKLSYLLYALFKLLQSIGLKPRGKLCELHVTRDILLATCLIRDIGRKEML